MEHIMILQVLVLSAVFCLCNGAKDTKRLVLHSDLDIAQEVVTLKSKLQSMELKFAELERKTIGDIGSTYIRWGRTTCGGNGSVLVYTGYTGGSPYSEEGGAADFVCLPDHPTWATYVDGVQNRGGHMQGSEFDSYLRTSFNPFACPASSTDDAPCTLCRAPYATTIMIPAKTECYPGWTLQYTGYLMSGLYSQKKATEFICMDGSPETELHGERAEGGAYLYFVEVECGSLPCQRYPMGRELACVVCSK